MWIKKERKWKIALDEKEEKIEEGVTSIQSHLHSCRIHYESSNQKEGVLILMLYIILKKN